MKSIFPVRHFSKHVCQLIHLKADENKDKHYNNTPWPFMDFFDFQLRDTSFSKLGRCREIIAGNCPRNFIFLVLLETWED